MCNGKTLSVLQAVFLLHKNIFKYLIKVQIPDLQTKLLYDKKVV